MNWLVKDGLDVMGWNQDSNLELDSKAHNESIWEINYLIHRENNNTLTDSELWRWRNPQRWSLLWTPSLSTTLSMLF